MVFSLFPDEILTPVILLFVNNLTFFETTLLEIRRINSYLQCIIKYLQNNNRNGTIIAHQFVADFLIMSRR